MGPYLEIGSLQVYLAAGEGEALERGGPESDPIGEERRHGGAGRVMSGADVEARRPPAKERRGPRATSRPLEGEEGPSTLLSVLGPPEPRVCLKPPGCGPSLWPRLSLCMAVDLLAASEALWPVRPRAQFEGPTWTSS